MINLGGTSLPGKIALIIYPNVLRAVSKQFQIIAVTGTNGKTTTVGIIASILDKGNIEYISNSSGANLLAGITTAFLLSLNWRGNSKAMYALMEVDEGVFGSINQYFESHIIVVTNFFKDQIGRFGGIMNVLNRVRSTIEQSCNALLILNSDDPLCASLGKNVDNKVIYYGFSCPIQTEGCKKNLPSDSLIIESSDSIINEGLDSTISESLDSVLTKNSAPILNESSILMLNGDLDTISNKGQSNVDTDNLSFSATDNTSFNTTYNTDSNSINNTNPSTSSNTSSSTAASNVSSDTASKTSFNIAEDISFDIDSNVSSNTTKKINFNTDKNTNPDTVNNTSLSQINNNSINNIKKVIMTNSNYDPMFCLYCGHKYEYTYSIYEHLGGFRCPNCDYKHPHSLVTCTCIENIESKHPTVSIRFQNTGLPSIKYPGINPNDTNGINDLNDMNDMNDMNDLIKTNNFKVQINVPGLFNIYNFLAATATGKALGIPENIILLGLSCFKPDFGRMKEIMIDGKPVNIILVKNPAGFNQVINYILTENKKLQLAFLINDKPGDDTDISWIQDVNFESLLDIDNKISNIMTAGAKSKYIFERIKLAGISEHKIKVFKNYNQLLSKGFSAITKEDKTYILATYTAMLAIKRILRRKYKVKDLFSSR